HSQESHTDYIYNMALTTTHLITASKDRTIRIWSLATQRLAHPPLESHTAAVLCVAVHEAKNLLFSGSVDKRMIVWDMESWDCVRVVEDAHEESVLSIAASEKFVVTASQDKTVKVWDIEHLARTDSSSIVTPMRCLTGHAAAVNALALTSDNIITGSGDRTIRIWDIETLTCIRTIQGHFEKGIAALALLPSGGKVVAGGSDMTVRIFDVATGVEEACLRGHTNLARSVCAMPGENEDEGGEVSIVSGSYDGKVRVW
ncbi:WD40-repeat-containing domain protein, partial [Lophiotrema nucula]